MTVTAMDGVVFPRPIEVEIVFDEGILLNQVDPETGKRSSVMLDLCNWNECAGELVMKEMFEDA